MSSSCCVCGLRWSRDCLILVRSLTSIGVCTWNRHGCVRSKRKMAQRKGRWIGYPWRCLNRRFWFVHSAVLRCLNRHFCCVHCAGLGDVHSVTFWKGHWPRCSFACWVTKATDTLRVCNTYCFSTATVVTRTRLSSPIYLLCLSCWTLGDGKLLASSSDLLTERTHFRYSLLRYVGRL